MTSSVLFLAIQILRALRIWYLGIYLFVSTKSTYVNTHGKKMTCHIVYLSIMKTDTGDLQTYSGKWDPRM